MQEYTRYFGLGFVTYLTFLRVLIVHYVMSDYLEPFVTAPPSDYFFVVVVVVEHSHSLFLDGYCYFTLFGVLAPGH